MSKISDKIKKFTKFEKKGNTYEFTAGASEEIKIANSVDVYLGLKEGVNLGGTTELTVGGSVGLFAGRELVLYPKAKKEIVRPQQTELKEEIMSVVNKELNVVKTRISTNRRKIRNAGRVITKTQNDISTIDRSIRNIKTDIRNTNEKMEKVKTCITDINNNTEKFNTSSRTVSTALEKITTIVNEYRFFRQKLDVSDEISNLKTLKTKLLTIQ